MKAFHGELKTELCAALSHGEFVGMIMGVLPKDMGFVSVCDIYELRPEFRDEYWRDVYRLNPAQYDYFA